MRPIHHSLAAALAALLFALAGAQEPALPAGAVARIPGGSGPVLFTPDGKHLLAPSVSEAHALTLWDVATRKAVRQFVGPKRSGTLFGTQVGFTQGVFSTDGATLVTGCSDGALTVWEVSTGKSLREWKGHNDFVHALDLSPDGSTLVSHGWNGMDGSVRVWDVATGKMRHELLEKGGRMPRFSCFSPSGKQIAIVNDGTGEVTQYDAGTGAKGDSFRVNHHGNLIAIRYTPDGKAVRVSSFGDRGAIRQYDLATGKELASFAAQRDMRAPGFGKEIVAVVTQGDKVLNLWDIATGKLLHKFEADSELWSAAVSPDGKLMATQGSRTAGVLLWAVPEAKQPRVRLLVPAYFYPAGDALKDWERLFLASARVPVAAIVNPASGPGKAVDANYVKVLARAKEHKELTLLGYVSTAYAKRKLDDVKADIDQWLKLYPGIHGVFFDEQASGADQVEYYAALREYAHGKNLKLVVTNPGTVCVEGYLAKPASDTACLFEGPKAFDPTVFPAWLGKYDAGRVAILSYKIATAQAMGEIVRQAREKKVGWCYVTDAEGANPWDRLPRYWEDEVAAVKAANEQAGKP
jgi:hypothetical protein